MRFLLISIILAVAAMSLFGCKGVNKIAEKRASLPPPSGHLMRYSHAEFGTVPQPNFQYVLERQDDGTASLFVSHIADEGKPDTVIVSGRVADRVEQLIKENNLQNYAHHYSPDVEVLDGYSWHYEAAFDCGTTLMSGGNNAGPGDNTLARIGQYLDSCYLAAPRPGNVHE